TALDQAIQNYNQLGLRFTLKRIGLNTSGCNATITAYVTGGGVGGYAGFPSKGKPYPKVTIYAETSQYGVDALEHVITHELGHTLGFRHSDFYNRKISCGSGGNEGSAGVGAIHIPGTPKT